MSTGQMQVRNAEMVRLLSSDLQLRYEPNFAWKSTCSAYLALPVLRAFWPMSSVDYTTADRANDLSGQGYHLTDNNTVEFGYDSLVPYVDFFATNSEYLSRADGGAANWADITGTETYVESAYRGLTFGGWFYFDGAAGASREYVIAKSAGAPQRGYYIRRDTAGGGGDLELAVSVDGTAETFVLTNVTAAVTTWMFLVGRFDPSVELALFVDSTKYTNVAAIPASLVDNTTSFTIGASGVPSLYMDGRASMCFLCAAFLSDAIILSLFHQTRAMFGV
jgi:hypothetical protein